MIRLTPGPETKPISIESLETRLTELFELTKIDREEGQLEKANFLETLQRLNAPPELIERRSELEAAMVTIAEMSHGQHGVISFLYFPGEEIIIGFSSKTHEEQGSPLAMRLAEELGYAVSQE